VLSGKRAGDRDGGTESTNPCGAISAIVFGSDQGLVGQFNDVVADYAIKTLAALPGKCHVWAVGERVHARLADAGLPLVGLFTVPNSVQAITPLVGQIQIESEAHRDKGENAPLWVFHNRPLSGALYEPVSQRLLPLDAQWQQGLAKIHWPTANLARGHGRRHRDSARTHPRISFHLALPGLRRILASENASRLAAMERADKNINDLLDSFTALPPVAPEWHRRRTLRRDLRIRGAGWITVATTSKGWK
jgi:F-type H+-transporting ATPase subunit gamma